MHYLVSVTHPSKRRDSHLPLTKWFLTTHLLCEAKKGMSACQIQRTVGMSYKTAWYFCHRIRHAMTQTDKPMLDVTMSAAGIAARDKLEREFRFNRRRRSDLFLDTLRHMITAPVLTFEKLTA
jgi:hypothetical protein